jgi:hypothetical protein
MNTLTVVFSLACLGGHPRPAGRLRMLWLHCWGDQQPVARGVRLGLLTLGLSDTLAPIGRFSVDALLTWGRPKQPCRD